MNSTFGADIIYTPKSYYPLEFQYLVTSMQKNVLDKNQYADFEKSIIILDNCSRNMDRLELMFLFKTEIYKLLMKKKPQLNLRKSHYEKIILEKLDKYIQNNREKLTPYSLWMAEILKSDLHELINHKLYKNILKYLKDGKINFNKNFLQLKSRFKLILPWAHIFVSKEPDELEDLLFPIMFETLNRLKIYCSAFSQLRNKKVSEKRPGQFYFFAVHKTKGQTEEDTIKKIYTILDLEKLDVRETRSKNNLLKWTPKDEPKERAPIPDIIPTPDPSYIYPKTLPVPVNDWNIDIE